MTDALKVVATEAPVATPSPEKKPEVVGPEVAAPAKPDVAKK